MPFESSPDAKNEKAHAAFGGLSLFHENRYFKKECNAMASVNNVSSSSTSSLYGNRNVISGLASGMDTETMIENAVSGIRAKITALQQKSTKVEWQQAAYRNIIDQILNFSNAYSSYSSSSNLSSASFFRNASMVTTSGKYADKVSASGKSSSSIQLLGVKQLAKAASYSVSGVGGKATGVPRIAGETLDLAENMKVSTISGSLTLNYGGNRSYTVSFKELDAYENAGDLAQAITDQLNEQNMTLSDGSTVTAGSRIGVQVDYDGGIRFYDKAGAGNTVYVSSASGDIADTLHISPSKSTTSIQVGNTALYNTQSRGEYLEEHPIKVTLDGVTKTISMKDYAQDAAGSTPLEKMVNTLNRELASAFGSGRVTVSEKDGGIQFEAKEGSIMSIQGGKQLGLGSDAEASYLDTSKTLGDVLKGSDWSQFAKVEAQGSATKIEAAGATPAYYVDAKGNRVKQGDDGNWYRVDAQDAFLYKFEMNGHTIGNFSENSLMENVTVAINNSVDAGVNVSYSKITNQYHFVAEETGSNGSITFGDGLAKALFGEGDGKQVTTEDGEDAVFSMSVNGVTYDGIRRSSNTFDVDGMSLSLKGTFGDYTDGGDPKLDPSSSDNEPVSFTYSADADKIVDAVKSMIDDYNALVTEIHSAYSTMPAEKSNGSRYEPLTDDDIASMSESAVAAYEAKAKQGILFADRDLSNLYSKLTSIITPAGQDGVDMRAIGLEKAYSNGLTTIKLDEEKLRQALANNPDKVKDVFTKTVDNGASSDGLMASLKSTLDAYAKSAGADKGILVEKAGSAKVPASIFQNALQSRLDEYDKQIEKWQDKLSDRVDYYTSQFTMLEQLIAEMNSQSSTLMGLMGGTA